MRDRQFYLEYQRYKGHIKKVVAVGEQFIPVGILHKRLHEFSQDKNTEIITYCKISQRGYEADVLLKAYDYTSVKVLVGGIAACPFVC